MWARAEAVAHASQQWDKDTLIFRSGPPVQRSIFSITFNEYDKVRIIDPPNETIKAAFVQVVHVGGNQSGGRSSVAPATCLPPRPCSTYSHHRTPGPTASRKPAKRSAVQHKSS